MTQDSRLRWLLTVLEAVFCLAGHLGQLRGLTAILAIFAGKNSNKWALPNKCSIMNLTIAKLR